ncbi:hypothetical protein HAX54_035666, partial [Datura stramonium]|nr:hypothetical protein [Datura stramonium]
MAFQLQFSDVDTSVHLSPTDPKVSLVCSFMMMVISSSSLKPKMNVIGFYSLPVGYWTSEALSKVANAIASSLCWRPKFSSEYLKFGHEALNCWTTRHEELENQGRITQAATTSHEVGEQSTLVSKQTQTNKCIGCVGLTIENSYAVLQEMDE